MSVEVKIGIADSPRELTVQTSLSGDEVHEQISTALGGDDPVVSLTDDKGVRYLIPVARVAYVEVGSSEARRVGFGT